MGISEVIRDNKLTGLCGVKMQSFWRNYKDGVLLAFILATGLGVLYDHGVSGQESVVPTPGQCIKLTSGVEFESFKQFYPFYLCEHTNPITKLFHFIGTFSAIMIWSQLVTTKTSTSTKVKMVFLALVQGYSWAWVSHFCIEKNKPATFKYPLYSFVSDFKMFSDYLTLKIPPYW